MGHSRFYYNNAWLLGDLSYSSQLAGFPASNTRQRWPSRTWRSGSVLASGEWIEISLESIGLSIQPSALFIKYCNLSSAAAIILAAYNSGVPAPAWTENIPLGSEPEKLIYHEFSPPASYPIWRLIFYDAFSGGGSFSFSGSGSGLSYIEIGKIFLGNYFQPDRDFRGGRAMLPKDESIINYSEGGQISAIKRQTFETRDYEYPANPPSQVDLFNDLFEHKQLVSALFFCEDYRELSSLNTFYCRLSQFDWQHLAGHGRMLADQKEHRDLKIQIETMR